MEQWNSIVQHINRITGDAFSVEKQQVVAGGSINSAFIIGDDKHSYFVKTNHSGRQAMFEAEAAGLQEIASSDTIKVPEAICFGDDEQRSYIVLEYLELKDRADQRLLGEQLAAMHHVSATHFGWRINNTIGVTQQPNGEMDDWLTFWRERRLGFQLQLAEKNGYGGELQILGEKLLTGITSLFDGYVVKPSMLHGDLWGGNVAGLTDGTPVIFDPAFYYGDRETDLAMTYVFGGFDADFYSSYQSAYPLDDGFVQRKTLYNIYHIINHLNMFGGGYHAQAINMMRQLLAVI